MHAYSLASLLSTSSKGKITVPKKFKWIQCIAAMTSHELLFFFRIIFVLRCVWLLFPNILTLTSGWRTGKIRACHLRAAGTRAISILR